MESISGTTLLGVRKGSDGLWLIIVAPTTGMTIDTSASLYAPGCICINTGSGKTYTNSGTTASPSWQDVNSITTAEIADAAVTPAKTNVVESILPSVAGTGPTCTISDTTTVANCSSIASTGGNVILPTPTVGRIVQIIIGATAAQLKSSTPASVGINGGIGAAAFSILAAGSVHELICKSATAWLGFSRGPTGTVTTLPAAA